MLKPQFDTLDDVPEALREYYPEKEGKYVFAGLDGYKPVSEFQAVQTALKKERSNAKMLEDSYTPWQTTFAGKTPQEIKAELDKIPVLEAESNGKISKEKIDALIEVAAKNRLAPVAAERDTYKTKISELEAQIQAFQEHNKQRKIFDAVREVAAKENIFHESAYASPEGALMLLAGRYFTVDESSDSVVIKEDVKGLAAGLGVKDALAEIRSMHPYLAKNSLGGGAQGSGGSSGGPNPFKDNNMSARTAFIKANPTTWQARMKEAGVKNAFEPYKGK